MGAFSSIGWCDHTFNPWMGCMKLTRACENCYAEIYVSRYFGKHWGPAATTPRKRTSKSTWMKPIQWDKKAAKKGIRYRVFCSSLADIFEDHPMLGPWRQELFTMVPQTPNLDWLFLTKRPENILNFIPDHWASKCPRNIWFMTTAEDQDSYDKRWLELEKVKAATGNITGVSMEPLMEFVDLRKHKSFPDWVIVGGESGKIDKISRLDMESVKGIMEQLPMSSSFFFKQTGSIIARELKWGISDPRGEHPENLPEEYDWCKVRQFPLSRIKSTLYE